MTDDVIDSQSAGYFTIINTSNYLCSGQSWSREYIRILDGFMFDCTSLKQSLTGKLLAFIETHFLVSLENLPTVNSHIY